jgi:hypothetical protein
MVFLRRTAKNASVGNHREKLTGPIKSGRSVSVQAIRKLGVDRQLYLVSFAYSDAPWENQFRNCDGVPQPLDSVPVASR